MDQPLRTRILVPGTYDTTHAPARAAPSPWLLAITAVTAQLGSMGCDAPLDSEPAAQRLGTAPATLAASTAAPAAAVWTLTGPSAFDDRTSAGATLLPDGRVLVVGGLPLGDRMYHAEIYDPATNTWSPAASTTGFYFGPGIGVAGNGKVLATLYYNAELYDPAANTWTAAPNTGVVREYPATRALPDGKLLLLGGVIRSYYDTAVTELYDPATNTLSLTDPPPLRLWAYRHQYTSLTTGEILMTGGNESGALLNDASLYDPRTHTWRRVASSIYTHVGSSATTLPDGTVLLAGGLSRQAGGPYSRTEIYTPWTNSWSGASIPDMLQGRSDHAALVLANCKLLVAGGSGGNSVELYDPFTRTWTADTPMNISRPNAQLILLADGRVLALGNGRPEVGTFPSGPCFHTGERYPSGAGSSNLAVVIANLDGNGAGDLVIAHGSSFTARTGTGTGTFGSAIRYASPASTLVTGDWNRDGHVDVASAGYSSTSGHILSVRPGRGIGTFQTAVTYALASEALDLATGDVNRDGNGDLVLATLGSVAVYLGNGDGTFQLPASIGTGGARHVVVGDWNGDGNLDVAAAAVGASSATLHLGAGTGAFAPAGSIDMSGAMKDLVAADVNGDGRLDLVAATSAAIVAALSTGNGTFQAAVARSLGAVPQGLAVRDLDGNGTADVIVAVQPGGTAVLAGHGDGTFAAPVVHASGSAPAAVAVGLIDGGSVADAVTVSNDVGAHVLLGAGDGTLLPAVSTAAGSGAVFVAAGDYDRDGAVDVVLGNEGSGSVSLLPGTAGGRLGQAVNQAIPGGQLTGVVSADLDGDGLLDLAVTHKLDSNAAVSVLRGNGDGTFQPAVATAAGRTASAVAAADVDRDGLVDLLVTDRSRNALMVLRGTGGGALQAGSSIATGSAPVAVAIGDVNGDGKVDAATADYNGDSVSVLLGSGDGRFVAGARLATGQSKPQGLVLADVNGDGHLDIAVAHFGSGVVTVHLGSGDGTFQAPGAVATLASLRGIVAEDFDGDGYIDLAVASSGTHDATVLRGRGDGTFERAIVLPAGSGSRALAIADLDRDGKPDLAVAAYNTNEVVLWHNRWQ